MLRNETVTLNA